MEQPRKSDRSSSDGSHRSYSASSLPQQRSGPLHVFLRPPLRSVNENSLLISPGALESMLKKTTETGDIGIFSIRPPRPSAAYHAPRPAARGGGGDPIWRNGRRRLPLYRDTTSEIISMYGSDSQRSVSSSLSMPFDESGRRSYSMTSCSSRPLPHQRSNGTLQSQASGSFLQRPRSPFPYPTRLKRPGVRPSSPAVTENVRVDYSKMVGIDRVSSRTVHGSYGPNPTPHGRQTAPRYGCLNAYNSGRFSSRHEGSSASQYPRGGLSTALTGQGGRYAGGFGVSMPEQRRRTSSLASMTDIYRSPSFTQSIRSCPRLSQASGAFYYDYSEDFEDRPAPTATNPVPSRAPLAPIPTRAPSARRASVLNDGFDSCFQVPSERDLAVTRQPHSPVKPYRDQAEPGDQHISSHSPHYQFPEDGRGEELHLLPETHQTNFDISNVEGSPSLRRWIYGQPTAHQQEQSGGRTERSAPKRSAVGLFGSDDYDQENHPIPNGRPEMRLDDRNRPKDRSSTPSPDRINLGTLSTTYPGTGPISALTFRSDKSEACSIEPGLADLVSFVPYLDRAAEWSNEDKVGMPVVRVGSGTDLAGGAPPHDVPPGDDNMLDSAKGEPTDTPRRRFSGFRGHRRNLAVPAIRASEIPNAFVVPTSSDDGEATSRSGTTTKPRTRASIPLLMESLTPFPSGSKSELCINNPVVDHGSAYPPRDEMGAFEMGRNHLIEPMNSNSRGAGSQVRPTNYPTSAVPERTSSREDYHNPRPSNGRLRLRVSRAALTKAQVRSRPSIGPFDGPENSQTSGGFDRDFHPTRTEGYQKQDERDGGLLENQDQRLSTTNGTKTPSLEGSAVLGDARTSLSGRTSTSIQPGRGLKKRVSDLCVRLAGSSIRSIKGDGASSNTESFPRPIGNTIHEKWEEDPSRPSHTSHRQLGRLGGRSSRWLRAARHAVMVACAGPRKH